MENTRQDRTVSDPKGESGLTYGNSGNGGRGGGQDGRGGRGYGGAHKRVCTLSHPRLHSYVDIV